MAQPVRAATGSDPTNPGGRKVSPSAREGRYNFYRSELLKGESSRSERADEAVEFRGFDRQAVSIIGRAGPITRRCLLTDGTRTEQIAALNSFVRPPLAGTRRRVAPIYPSIPSHGNTRGGRTLF